VDGAIEAIVLAAGQSTRMGAVDKLLLPIGGVPMVRRCVAVFASLASPVTVVVNDRKGAAARSLAGLDVNLAENPVADADQQGSARIGLAAAELAGRGLLIGLADQPLLVAADVVALIAAFDAAGGDAICIPRFAGQRGNPLLWPASLARAVRDAGASPRGFIDANPARIRWFDAANDHYTRDVDTPEDAARLLDHRIGHADTGR